jgi:hypothetical protein
VTSLGAQMVVVWLLSCAKRLGRQDLKGICLLFVISEHMSAVPASSSHGQHSCMQMHVLTLEGHAVNGCSCGQVML